MLTIRKEVAVVVVKICIVWWLSLLMAGEGIIEGILLCYFYSLQKIPFWEKGVGWRNIGEFFRQGKFSSLSPDIFSPDKVILIAFYNACYNMELLGFSSS